MEGSIPKPWELHPMLVHFPIAFLLGGVLLLLWACWRPSEMRHRNAAGLLLAGTIFGWLAAAAGALAFFTVPAHTEEGHNLMYWHLGLGSAMLLVFAWLAVVRWRRRTERATRIQLTAGIVGALLLSITGYLGGAIVYHHGAGVNPDILAPEIREGHSHRNQPADEDHLEGDSAHQHDGR